MKEWEPRVRRSRRIPLTEDERRSRDAAAGYSPEKEFVPPGGYHTRYTLNKAYQVENSTRYGPFVKTFSRVWPGTSVQGWYKKTTSYRSKSKKVRRNPNPYNLYTAEIVKFESSPGQTPSDATNALAGYYAQNPQQMGTYDALAANKAREGLVNQMKDKTSASLAVTLAEWKQSEKMIAVRASQLLRGVKALKRGDVRGLERALQIDVSTAEARAARKNFRGRGEDSVRKGSRDLSAKWLEYHFGWSPLLDDIQQAVKVLGTSPPLVPIRASGRAVGLHTKREHIGVTTYNQDMTYVARCMTGCEVRVTNPNFALANQLGLINPGTVAWEIVPFSFLVDWFIPVGAWLNSFTDILGYDVLYPFTTTTREVKAITSSFPDPPYLTWSRETSTGFWFARALGLPAYKLVRPPFRGFSVARAATAIALLVQQFLSLDKSKKTVFNRTSL